MSSTDPFKLSESEMSATCNATRAGPAGCGVLSLGVLVLTME